jgi:hypothetical protein
VQSDKEKLRIVIRKICAFCARYEASQRAINAGTPDAIAVQDMLKRLARYLARVVPVISERNLTISTSRANPSLPRVPWIAVLPAGRTVSSGLSVALCFGRQGDGLVAGLMKQTSMGATKSAECVVRERGEGFIDVDGSKLNTKYNDRFINPIDFPITDFNVDSLVAHITRSLDRL